MTVLPALPVYPLDLEEDDHDGTYTSDALIATIKDAILNHPRSLQTRIGPSEVGHSCARRIGYKLLGHPETNAGADVPWLPTIGTGVHGWLEDTFTDANGPLDEPRWLTEMTVSVGEIGSTDITGHADLFDRSTGTVIDWKIVGPTTLRKYKAGGPSPEYRAQAHLYGRGFTRRGLRVRRVMIAFLPRNSELRDAHIWSEPYNEQIALDALNRAEGIHLTTSALGLQGLAVLPTADAYCARCPFYRAASTDLAAGCPGDPAANVTTTSGAFSDLIPAG